MNITNGGNVMSVTAIAFLAGRGLLAALFILAGVNKIVGPRPVLAHMKQQHVPGFLLPIVAIFEITAGGALLVGWQAPIAASALALFCLATAIVFHRNFADRAERTQFTKDIALAGGLVALAAAAMGA
jgi:putative oxidoreductase